MPEQEPKKRGPIVFLASQTRAAQDARAALVARYGEAPLAQAGVIVALGGDGFMLETLHATQTRDIPVYGMNRGTVGFLLNAFSLDELPQRLAAAQETFLHPLAMTATDAAGVEHEALAINEVSLLALTAMSAFRPRRWRGALLPKSAVVQFDVLEPEKRPVMADADAQSVRNVVRVVIRSDPGVQHRLLFDPGHGLEERLIREQFY